jgi:competence protein ComEA
MFNISKKSMIIISCIGAIIIASCGYSIINGKIAGEVTVKGSTQRIEAKEVNYEKKMISIPEKKEIVVHIIGKVKNPGLVIIPDEGRISDAIKEAGGILPDADLEIINLAYKLQDGQQVYIPSKNESKVQIEGNKLKTAQRIQTSSQITKKIIPGVQPYVSPLSKAASDSAGVINDNHSQGQTGDMVNINTADEKALDVLPGIGPSTAKKIIEYRNTNGIFKKTEDIMNVKGIGKSKYENVKSKIVI